MNGSASGLRTCTENWVGDPTTHAAFSQRFMNTTAVFPRRCRNPFARYFVHNRMETPMTSCIFELGQTLPGYAVLLPQQNAVRCQVAGLAQAMGHKTIGQQLNAGL